MPKPNKSPLVSQQKKDVQWKFWVLGVAILAVLIIVLQNSQSVEFHLLFISTTAPLIVLLLGMAIIGAIIGFIGPIMRRHRHNTRREYGKE